MKIVGDANLLINARCTESYNLRKVMYWSFETCIATSCKTISTNIRESRVSVALLMIIFIFVVKGFTT